MWGGGEPEGIKRTGVKHDFAVVTFLRTCCKHEFISTLLRTFSYSLVKIYTINFYQFYHSQLSNHFAKYKRP